MKNTETLKFLNYKTNNFMYKSTKGYAILEVIVVLGIISFFIVVIGKTLFLVNTLNATSQKQTKALYYAQESLEIINDLKNDFFACTCGSDNCIGDTCARAIDGQSCSLFSAYTSCWTEYPEGFVGQTDYFFEAVGASWQLKALTGPVETIAGDPDFQRKIIIKNIKRDANGDIADSGTADPNTKQVTVIVWYEARGVVHNIKLKTILTAWENL